MERRVSEHIVDLSSYFEAVKKVMLECPSGMLL